MNTVSKIIKHPYGNVSDVHGTLTSKEVIRDIHIASSTEYAASMAIIINGKIIQPGPFTYKELTPYL